MERITALPRGLQLMLVGGVLLLIDTFFHWQEVNVLNISVGRNAWHGWGVLVGVLAIVLLAWLAARLAGTDIQMPVSDTLAGALLAALILVFTLLKILVDNEFRTVWAWIGLLLAAVIAVGAWFQVTQGGGIETLRTEASELKTRGAGAPEPGSAPPPPSPPGDTSPPEGGANE